MDQTRSRAENRLARLADAYQARPRTRTDTRSRDEDPGGGSAYSAVVDVIFPPEADQLRGANWMRRVEQPLDIPGQPNTNRCSDVVVYRHAP